MSKRYFMAINNYGETIHGLERPRKDLLSKLGATHADRIYLDGKDGKTYHAGYIVRGEWWELYEVTPYRKEVK